MSHKATITPTSSTSSMPTIIYKRPQHRLNPTTPQPQRSTRHLQAMLGMLLLTCLTAFLGAAAGLSWYWYDSDRILPGVYILNTPIGAQSVPDATQTISAVWAEQTITVNGPDGVWILSAEQLGFALDIEATTQQAYQQGRTGQSWSTIWQSHGRIHTSPIWQLDKAVAEVQLQQIASQLITLPQNAHVDIIDGQAYAIPAQPGYAINIPGTLTYLLEKGDIVLQNGSLPLIVDILEPTITNVNEVVTQANQLLSHTLTVQAYDPIFDESFAWHVPSDIWGTWITINPAANFSWVINTANIEAYITTQSGKLENGRYLSPSLATTVVTDALLNQTFNTPALRVFHPERTHIVQAGETLGTIGHNYGIPYPWLQQANLSIGELLAVGQAITIPSPDLLVPLPLVPHKRVIVSITEQKVWVYENGNLKWEWVASTGINTSPTAPGIFQIQTHEENAYAGNWNLWMPHFLGIYRPVPTSDFMNGFHGFPTRNGSTLLWTGDLGHPVTYGCVLLSSENAEHLYNWAETGTIVEIQA